MEITRNDHRQVSLSAHGLQYQDLISAVVEGPELASVTLNSHVLKKSVDFLLMSVYS